MATEHAGGAGRRRSKPEAELSEAIRQFVADTVTEKLAQTSAKQADKVAAKAAKHVERLTARLDALDTWTRSEPGRRQPRFTRAEIAAVAVRIADAEGLDAVSMRRIAAELGAGTMTLYHYVRTKDELLTLVTDAVMGEVVVPADQPLPDDWRDAISLIARRSRASLRSHPWILDIADDPPIGPNSVAHFDQSLRAVASLPGTLADRLDVITAVDEYVFGFCMHERNHLRDDDATSKREMLAYVTELVASGDYPEIAKLAERGNLESLWTQVQAHARDETRFDRTLARLLDGIQAGLVTRE